MQILLACGGAGYSASATGESDADAAACDVCAPGYSGSTADGIGKSVWIHQKGHFCTQEQN